jgi:hypothetical protein
MPTLRCAICYIIIIVVVAMCHGNTDGIVVAAVCHVITVSTHPRLPDVDAKVHCIVLM